MRPTLARGFTLLEILVAFVVLAAGAGILYRTFSTGLNNVDAVSGYSEAIALAEAKLSAVGLEHALAEGDEQGTSEDRRFDWRVTVAPYTPPDGSADPAADVSAHVLLRATVTVSWNQRGYQKRSLTLSTIRIAGKSAV
jgi:general secretion pathway protein I